MKEREINLSKECNLWCVLQYKFCVTFTVCITVLQTYTQMLLWRWLFLVFFLCRVLCDCNRQWTCQQLLMRAIINARWYRFQNYGATSRPREIDSGCCRSYTRRWRTRLIRTAGSISARSARNSFHRATRCIDIIDTSATRCRVINALIVATSASGLTRSTIISGSFTRDRRSRWTSSTSPAERAIIHVGKARLWCVRC